MFLKEPAGVALNNTDQTIIAILKKAPHSLFYLAHQTGLDADALGLQQLVDLGLIGRIALTPTDILHVCGQYNKWDTVLARAGTQIMAARTGKSVEEFVESAVKAVVDRLCLIGLQSLAGFENNQLDLFSDKAAMYLIEKAFDHEKQRFFSTVFTINKPIVAIGAPVQAWMGGVAKKMNTRLVIPEHAEVASAIGAAVGKVVQTIKVLIRPGEGGDGYIMHASWERRLFTRLEEAAAYGLSEAKKQAAATAQKAGGKNYEFIEHREDIYNEIFTSGRKIYIESRLEVMAIGRPAWED